MDPIKTTICLINELSYQDLALLIHAKVLNPAEIKNVYASPYRVVRAEDASGLLALMVFVHVPSEASLLITGICKTCTDELAQATGDAIDNHLAKCATELGCRQLLMTNALGEAVQIRDYIFIPQSVRALEQSSAAIYLN